MRSRRNFLASLFSRPATVFSARRVGPSLETEKPDDEHKIAHGPWQFGLRTLLLLVTSICVCLGLLRSDLELGLFLSFVAAMTGCRSPGRNPAGVYSNDVLDGLAAGGSIPLGGRFTGGAEHPGMFEPVYFAYDSSQVTAGEQTKVEAVSQYLRQNPNTAVIVEGHCDERGSLEYNLSLGERRALAIRAYLTELGIGADRIQTKSLGEEQPVASGHDESAWSQNRRGEFVLYY